MIGLIGSSFFAGVILGMFIIPRLADLKGRKWPIIACSFLQVPLYIWMFFMSTLIEAYVIFFFFGVGFVGNVSIGPLYIQEFLQKRHRAISICVIQTLEGFVVILCVLYFVYITKDWKPWYYFVLGQQLLIIVGLLWLPESPEYYFSKGRFAES